MGRILGLAASLWVLMGLVPSAWANPFLTGAAVCADSAQRWQSESSEPMDRSIGELHAGDCDTGSLDDPSFNVCFEGAEVPISTLPQLLAEAQAERVARQVAGAAGIGLRLPDADADAEREQDLALSSADEQPEPIIAPRIPRPRAPALACSSYPEECNALPAIPHLELAGASASASHPEAASYLAPPHTLQLPEPGPWAHHGLGPANEHRAPPETPPRA